MCPANLETRMSEIRQCYCSTLVLRKQRNIHYVLQYDIVEVENDLKYTTIKFECKIVLIN